MEIDEPVEIEMVVSGEEEETVEMEVEESEEGPVEIEIVEPIEGEQQQGRGHRIRRRPAYLGDYMMS